MLTQRKKPLHAVENWLVAQKNLGELMQQPYSRKQDVVAKWLALSRRVGKPITPAKFLSECEDRLSRTYGVERFQHTKAELEDYARRNVDIHGDRVKPNLKLLNEQGHSGYLNAVRHRFYAEIDQQLAERISQLKRHGTKFRESPHPQLIRETAAHLRITKR